MPGRVRQVLADCGMDLSSEELLDALWLAERLPGGTSAPMARALGVPAPSAPDGSGEAAASEPPACAGPSDAVEDEPAPLTGALHASAETSNVAVRTAPPVAALPVRAPEEKALGTAELRLGRALRPLKQYHRGGCGRDLDERATVDAMAETGLPDVVLRPSRERRLDLALVVDDGLSMLLWRRLATELRALLERLGAFRSVRVHGLDTRAVGEPALRGRPFAPDAPFLPAGSAADPTGRTLVLVVSDGVGPAWRDGRMRSVLERWARCGPTAVVHALPARMWGTSGICTEDWQVTVRRTAAANRTWTVADPVLPPELASFDGVPVPVLEPEPASVGRWARMTASTGGTAVLPLLAGPSSGEVPRPVGPARADDDPVLRFRNAASPEAYRLAAHLAAVAPVSVPVMRLVQTAVPWQAETAHLAEVFLGGLMRRTDGGGHGTAAQHQSFDFTERARATLLDTVPASELAGTNRAVADRLGQLAGRSPDFPAWLVGPGGVAGVSEESRPFANLGGRLMARLGAGPGRHSRPAVRRPEVTAESAITAWARSAWVPLGPDDPRSLGPYTLYARNDTGALTVLYLGRDTWGRRAVVRMARTLHPDSALQLLRTSATALRRMAGHHAPGLLEDSLKRPPYWVAEELVVTSDGEPAPPLPTVVQEKGALSGDPEFFHELGWNLAHAVHHCHDKGIVHGGLTPGAVLLPVGASVCLSSWSRAVIGSRSGPAQSVLVTDADYRAPELQNGSGRSSTASDVYALGVILLGANYLWPERNVRDALLHGRLLSAVGEPDVGEVLRRCIAPDPDDRPTAYEVAQAFAARVPAPLEPGARMDDGDPHAQCLAAARSPAGDAAHDERAPAAPEVDAQPTDPAPSLVSALPPTARLWVPQRRTPWAKANQEHQLALIQMPLNRCHRIVVASPVRYAGTSTTAHALGALLASLRPNSRVALITSDRKWFAGRDASGLRIPRIERDPNGPMSTPESYRRLVNSLRGESDVLITDTDSGAPLPSGHLTDSLVDQLVIVAAPPGRRVIASFATEILFQGLAGHASARLLSESLAVVSQHHGSAGARRDLADSLRGRCRGVVGIPSDSALAGGRFPDPALLRGVTRDRYLELASLVAAGFPPQDQ